MVSSVAQRLDAPLVHVGLGQVEVEVRDLVHASHCPCDHLSILRGCCLVSVNEGKQRVPPSIMIGGVKAGQRPLRRRYRNAPIRQVGSQRQCGVGVGLVTPEFDEPLAVGECVGLEP